MKYYSVTEASEILGLNRCSVAQMLKRIDAPKVGNQYVIDEKLLEYLENRKGKRGQKIQDI